MRLIDEQYLATPFYGSRKLRHWLNLQGYRTNRKRVQRLMRLMGIEAIYRKPRTTVFNPENKVFPYLLRNVAITHCNHVWSTDITYIPMRHGFMYLVAVIDWYSRHVLSWRLSNSLDASFCLEALADALTQGTPEIFNTDQGTQFTSLPFTSMLESSGIAISMDGRGRALDNVFIERLWRSLRVRNRSARAQISRSQTNFRRVHRNLHRRRLVGAGSPRIGHCFASCRLRFVFL